MAQKKPEREWELNWKKDRAGAAQRQERPERKGRVGAVESRKRRWTPKGAAQIRLAASLNGQPFPPYRDHADWWIGADTS